MDQKTKRVFRGYLQLSKSEQMEFVVALSKYMRQPSRDQEATVKEYEMMDAANGPVHIECPCCGK